MYGVVVVYKCIKAIIHEWNLFVRDFLLYDPYRDKMSSFNPEESPVHFSPFELFVKWVFDRVSIMFSLVFFF